ncbi:small integral membrane protein 14 [Anthonomus grandis grandis]|uniref:small integral membrane protein 14 n=1 Tax=Anthonomus grandis grandis TaxID=2921223 RepID=UPI0021666C81|nr:small integral membrane protein 14 [Anthonomus grandis grandis]
MGDEAGGGGYDHCACIWDHAMAMRRLLTVLRNSQTVCTDTECFEPGLGLPGTSNNTPGDLLLLTVMLGIALIMFYFRPWHGRATVNLEKKRKDNGDFDRAPPAPPVD